MRRRDYRCTNGHVFEYLDSMTDPIHEYLKCPACGEPAKRQVARGVMIGKIDRGTYVTDFHGGTPDQPTRVTLTRDEVERRLAYRPPKPFENDPTLQDRIADRVDRMIAKQDAGELPPPKELTSEQRDLVEKALKRE